MLAEHSVDPRTALSYGLLYQHIGKMGRTLRAMGIGRRDRVAVALPNGPAESAALPGYPTGILGWQNRSARPASG